MGKRRNNEGKRRGKRILGYLERRGINVLKSNAVIYYDYDNRKCIFVIHKLRNTTEFSVKFNLGIPNLKRKVADNFKVEIGILDPTTGNPVFPIYSYPSDGMKIIHLSNEQAYLFTYIFTGLVPGERYLLAARVTWGVRQYRSFTSFRVPRQNEILTSILEIADITIEELNP